MPNMHNQTLTTMRGTGTTGTGTSTLRAEAIGALAVVAV